MKGGKDLLVRIGGLDIEVSGLRMTSSISDLSNATMVAQISRTATPDWSRPLTVDIDGNLVHTGSVISAIPSADGVTVDTTTGVEMTEVLMPMMAAEDFPAQDVVYDAARGAGFKRERMEIHGLDDLPIEPMEVVVPLKDVRVTRPTALGRVTLLPTDIGRQALAQFRSPPEAASQAWGDSEAFALMICNSSLLTEATVEALELLDAVLSLLIVRARFGHARLPDGTLTTYTRTASRSLPRREGPISVRGLLSGKRWLKDPETITKREPLDLEAGDLRWPGTPTEWSSSERLSWLAACRAASATDPIEKATAISEAWEFYCADVVPQPIFTEDERDRLRRELPDWLSEAQRHRAAGVLDTMLNSRPLWHRVTIAFERDGVLVTKDEWRTLRKVRNLRNRAVHGSEALEFDADDLDLAISVLSRAITYRIARKASLDL